MSSRLAIDQHGRTVAVVTTPAPFLAVGMCFPVVDALELNTWLKAHGRPPTAKERAEARPPLGGSTDQVDGLALLLADARFERGLLVE